MARFERIGLYIFLALVFLLPIFFIPSNAVPFQMTKSFLVVIAVLLGVLVWVVARLKDGVVKVDKTWLSVGLVGLPVAALLSGIFSANQMVSMFGSNMEVGSAVFIALLALLALLIPSFTTTRDRIFYSYLAFIASFLLVALFEIARLAFGPDFLSFGIFTTMIQNPIGSWSELGIFFGLATMLSVVTLELLTLSRSFKILLYIALAVSLLLAIVVNITTVWYVLGVFSIVLFVYLVTTHSRGSGKRFISYLSIGLFVVSLIFILGGPSFTKGISDRFKIQDLDVRPSWSATFDVLGHTLKEEPVFGAGPNRFVNKWLVSKPVGLNTTAFWNTDFNYGIGLIPTFFVTQGILGMIAWVAFFALLLGIGFRALFRTIADAFSRYFIVSSFLVATYLWVFAVVYVPSIVLFTLAFIFTGIFVAALEQEGIVKTKELHLFKEAKTGFVSILALVVLLVLVIIVGSIYIQKYNAAVSYQSSIVEYNQKSDIEAASKGILAAAQTSALDRYYQSLTDIDIARMNTLVARKDLTPEALQTQFQAVLASAVVHANQATMIDLTNYQNWAYLGRVYEAVLPLGITAAYDKAKAAYLEALKLNPQSPALLLTLARLEAVNRKFPEAKEYIGKAIQMKNNYTEAIFLLAQIQIEEGNLKDAITSVEAAAFIAPSDASILFQLGYLRYNYKDWKGTIDAMNKAIAINTDFANARYYLGLAYAQLADYKNAAEQFKVIKALNPDNKEVDTILATLLAGKSPFVAPTPAVTAPAKNAKLPVKEK